MRIIIGINIRDLTITPELWLVEILESKSDWIIEYLLNTFSFDIIDLFKDVEYLKMIKEFEKLGESRNERTLAKSKYSIFINRVEAQCNKSIEVVEENLIRHCVEKLYSKKIYEIIGSTINPKM